MFIKIFHEKEKMKWILKDNLMKGVSVLLPLVLRTVRNCK